MDSWLIQHHLLHRLHLPISTPQTSLITSITTAMTASPLQYQFPSPRDNTLAPHESLSLQPLGLSAKGAPRANGQIYLRPKPVKPEIKLSDLMVDKTVYSGKPCIEGGEWGLYFSKLCSMVLQMILMSFNFSNLVKFCDLYTRSISAHMSWILVLPKIFRRYGDAT